MDQNYWENRYRENDSPWDIGYPSTPLKAYIDQIENKELKILIPGCGKGYEAEYLFNTGFRNVFVADYAAEALQDLSKRVPLFPKDQLLQGDFFSLDGQFDLILEQTFFCALDLSLRTEYAKKMHQLLNSNGKLVGVLFNHRFDHEGPPYGGDEKEYRGYFEPYFKVKTMDLCYNSIAPRANRELFIVLVNSEKK